MYTDTVYIVFLLSSDAGNFTISIYSILESILR